MKKVDYICDICGETIDPKLRQVSHGLDKALSSVSVAHFSRYKSFMRLKVSQIRTCDNCSERDMEVDLCDNCWDKIANIILKEVKV